MSIRILVTRHEDDELVETLNNCSLIDVRDVEARYPWHEYSVRWYRVPCPITLYPGD